MIDLDKPDLTGTEFHQGMEQKWELREVEGDCEAILIHDLLCAFDNRCRDREWQPDHEHDKDVSRHMAARAQALGYNFDSYYANE